MSGAAGPVSCDVLVVGGGIVLLAQQQHIRGQQAGELARRQVGGRAGATQQGGHGKAASQPCPDARAFEARENTHARILSRLGWGTGMALAPHRVWSPCSALQPECPSAYPTPGAPR